MLDCEDASEKRADSIFRTPALNKSTLVIWSWAWYTNWGLRGSRNFANTWTIRHSKPEHYHRSHDRPRWHVYIGCPAAERKSECTGLVLCVWVPTTAVWLLHKFVLSTALRHAVMMLVRARALRGCVWNNDLVRVLVHLLCHPLCVLSTAILTFIMLPHTLLLSSPFTWVVFTKTTFHLCPGHAWGLPNIHLF